MLNAIAINSSYPVIGRYPQRTLVASLNATIINLVNQHIRASRFAHVEALGIELPTEVEMDLEAKTEELQRTEQGLIVQMPPLEQASMLKLIRDALASDLLKHAGIVNAEMNGKVVRTYNQFDLGLSIEDTLDFRIKAAPPAVSEAEIQALMTALNVTRDEVLMAKATQHQTDVNFLKNNREDILQIIEGLRYGEYDLDDAEIVFDKLPVITQLRLYAAAMRGVMKGRQNELNGFIRQRPDAAGNMAMLDSLLLSLWDKLDRFEAQPAHKAAIDEAISRGVAIPNFPNRPAPRETTKHIVHKDGTRTAVA